MMITEQIIIPSRNEPPAIAAEYPTAGILLRLINMKQKIQSEEFMFGLRENCRTVQYPVEVMRPFRRKIENKG